MYLAPLNYDRYFKKVFSDLRIAKRFLEDFLDITILEIEFLGNKKNLTDDAQTVEFDFRCKTPEGHFIIEMQQYYKPDVVQRFYVYHAVGAALQLEDMPKKVIPLPDGKTRNVRDYGELLPTITIIWMVHDTLGFTDDCVSYVLTPKYISDFIKEVKEWHTTKCDELAEKHAKMLQMLNNTEKNLDFLSQNKLIYAFQRNIVKNQHYKKYFEWFELAEKTLNKISEKIAFDKYLKDEILGEVVRKLKKELSDADSEGYIKTYEDYIQGVLRYDQGIRKNLSKSYEYELSASKAREEEERRQKEEAKAREKEAMLKLAKNMKKYNEPIDEIIKETGLNKEEIESL